MYPRGVGIDDEAELEAWLTAKVVLTGRAFLRRLRGKGAGAEDPAPDSDHAIGEGTGDLPDPSR